MNKKILLGALTLYFVVLNDITAQNGATNINQNGCFVTYKFISKLRLAEIEQPAHLIIQGGSSIFIHSKGPTGYVNKFVEAKQPNGATQMIEDGYWQDSIGSIFFKDLINRKLIIREIVWMQPYLVMEPSLPNIKWSIQSEQKKIGQFVCQKAETNFRGRNYTAWFCSEISFADGPWKFHGLPGLILEVYDEEDQIKFLFESIEIPFNTKGVVKPPTNGEKISFKDYKRADDIQFEKMRRKNMSTQERGSDLEIKRVNKNLIERNYER